MIHGYKTKIGCIGMLFAAGLFCFYPQQSIVVFMASIALAFYGLYDRGKRSTVEIENKQAEKIDELKAKIKKPMLRGSI